MFLRRCITSAGGTLGAFSCVCNKGEQGNQEQLSELALYPNPGARATMISRRTPRSGASGPSPLISASKEVEDDEIGGHPQKTTQKTTMGNLANLTKIKKEPSIYDIVVVGGGSAGLSCALEASKIGLSVAVVNYVKPTPLGTKWGLGGTCLNVGCIPKFFYHEAARQRRMSDLRVVMGIENANYPQLVDWPTLSESVSNYTKSESFRMSVILRHQNIKLYNKFGRFESNTKLGLYGSIEEYEAGIPPKKVLKGKNFLIATGERPKVSGLAGMKGLEKAVTSDDIFRIRKRPKKVLVLGSGFVAIELVSFLQGLGVQTSCYFRSVILRSKSKNHRNGAFGF